MYRRFENHWSKHIGFVFEDSILWQAAFLIAYWIRFGFFSPFEEAYYLQVSILLFVINICVVFFGKIYKGILKRNTFYEAVQVVKQVALTIGILLFYLYLIKQNEPMSRLFFGYLIISSLILIWSVRSVHKYLLNRRLAKRKENLHSVLVFCESKDAEEMLMNIEKAEWRAVGFCFSDTDKTGEEIKGVPVVANGENLLEYIKKNVVDGLFMTVNGVDNLNSDVQKACMEMGVSTHIKITEDSSLGGESMLDTVGDFTVLTRSIKIATAQHFFIKRFIDILAGLAGVIVTGICFIFVAPIIYIKSPGPVFFTQTRIGKNGRKFKIYKFRSMYMDAEERKKELMEQNKIADGMMFKMDDDPRIIKGVGHFIRDYSIDELPQFWNVLKGDMSLIGTRPPTVEEYEKYDFHHKVRLAIKPGITGMWQTSGRSNITDFEEVVKLDSYYITNWSFALDLKILLKTFKVVFKKDGAS